MPENIMTLELFEENALAVHEGRATELHPCDQCGGKLRGIMKTSITWGSDPSEVLHLNCGHKDL